MPRSRRRKKKHKRGGAGHRKVTSVVVKKPGGFRWPGWGDSLGILGTGVALAHPYVGFGLAAAGFAMGWWQKQQGRA